jgi:hypothetical protein
VAQTIREMHRLYEGAVLNLGFSTYPAIAPIAPHYWKDDLALGKRSEAPLHRIANPVKYEPK